MFTRTKLSLGLLAAFGTLAVMVPGAQAQTLERVEITGSRLKYPNADSPTPVHVVTGEEIAKSGVANIQELLLKNPTLGTPTYSRTNSNFATSSAGVATIDLRNLGSDRTLVLVNGRRFVAGIPGSAAVDLNAIPTDFIDRVEIMTGGASAAYGSDAVAGVVNIILKRNFQGVIVDAQKGVSERGDDKKDKFSLTVGSRGADGKAGLMAHLGYSKQGAVYAKDRGAAQDDISAAFLTDDAADLFRFTSPYYSSYAPQGRIWGASGNFTFDKDGNIIPWSTNGNATTAAQGYNRQELRTIAIPTERFVFSTKGDYSFHKDHTIFMEGTYAQTQTRSKLEPFPLAAEDIFPSTGGQVPAEFLVNGVAVRNPMVPLAVYNLLNDTDGDGLKDYYFTRRISEVGYRGNVADRDTFRLVTGVKGTLLEKWDYDTYIGYGATKESQVSSGQVNVLNFKNALQAVPDVGDVDGDGDTTEAVCLSEDARAQGCVPISIFGYNSISPAAMKYVQAPGLLATFTSQRLAGGVIRGDAVELPAGPLSVAVGFETRREHSRSEFDPLQQAGLNAGNAIPRTEGTFDVKELFAEARVPVLSNAPFAKTLAVNAAVRGSKYSTIGGTTSWTTGLDWAPSSDVRFRASRALATRAPNINELYSPPSQTYESVSDPCVGVKSTDTSATATKCLADPGVAANVAANGSFTLNQSDLQGTSGYDRGNPDVQEEKGHSWTLGMVLTPSHSAFAKKFAFTADYFRIKVNDAIVSTPRQFAVNQCYSGDAAFCQFVTRRSAVVGGYSAGSISYVDSAVSNSGGMFTEGIDLTAAYGDKVGPGVFNSRLAYTYLRKGYTIPAAGSDPDEFAGEVGAAKHRASLQLGYKFGDFGVAATTTYIGGSAIDDQLLKDFGVAPGSIKVPAKTYLDLQFSYSLAKEALLYFGIDNATGTRAPRFDTNGLITGGTTGTGTAADVYDAIGRRYFLGIRMEL